MINLRAHWRVNRQLVAVLPTLAFISGLTFNSASAAVSDPISTVSATRGATASTVLRTARAAPKADAESVDETDNPPADAELVPDLSTATSTTYQLPDGTFALYATQQVMNYQDSDGDWHPVDNTLVDAPGNTYAVENSDSDFTVDIPADASATPVRLATDGLSIAMKLRGLSGAPDVAGDTATFEDAPSADSVDYTAIGNGVKESITLSHAPSPLSPLQFVYDVTVNMGITPLLKENGSISFVDASGSEQARIPAATMWDASEMGSVSAAVSYGLSGSGTTWVLTMTPDLGWLEDPSRVYPVVIDPTTTTSRVPSLDCTINSATTTDCDSDQLLVGLAGSGAKYRAMVQFPALNLRADANIINANLKLHLNTHDTYNGKPNTDIGVHPAQSPWDSTITWQSPYHGNPGNLDPGNGPDQPSHRTLGADADDNHDVLFWIPTTVRNWQTNPASNFGVVVKEAGDVESDTVRLHFASAQGQQAPNDNRPLLYVQYGYPTSLTTSPTETHCADRGGNNGAVSVWAYNGDENAGSVTVSAAGPVNVSTPGQYLGVHSGGSFSISGLTPGTYAINAHIDGQANDDAPVSQVTVSECAPIPYEPGAPPTDTIPERDGQAVPVDADSGGPATSSAFTAATASLPTATTATATVPGGGVWASFGSSPVAVRGSQVTKSGQTATAGAQTAGDQVQMSMTQIAAAAGGVSPGLQVAVTTIQDAEQPASTGPNDDLDLRLSYAGLAKAYGGGFADRLTVRAFPACYATNPSDPACQISTPVPAVNDATAQQLSFPATPPLKTGESAPAAPTAAQLDGCFAATSAAPSSPTASPSPTPDPAGFSTDPTPTGDADGSFDDANAADDPSAAATATTNIEPVLTPSSATAAQIAAAATTGAGCRGLVYQVTGGTGPYGMTAVAAAAGGDPSMPGAATLATSAQWQVGDGTGDFAWSYPLTLPTGMSPTVPQLSLDYSSASVDGNSSQASPAGLGWTLDPGHISRTYTSCSEDGDTNSGNLCWRTQGADDSDDLNRHLVDDLSLVLQGHSTRLIRDDSNGTGVWRLQDDPGWRVEKFNGSDGVSYTDTGTPPDNADGDDEAFRLTSPDGTKYFFGYYASANSVWTVPVRGTNAQPGDGEPCSGQGLSTGACRQGWQWNLDQVIDSDGNRVRYDYATETNYYRPSGANTNLPYVAAGHLTGISYGYAKNGAHAGEPQVTVSVDSVARCTQALDTEDSATAQDRCAKSGASWPDVPNDLTCADASSACGLTSPAFFSRLRYSRVTTYRGRSSSDIVDRYTLHHSFPAPPSGSTDDPSLWLTSISHGGATSETRNPKQSQNPDVYFRHTMLPNLVVARGSTQGQRPRLSRIFNEMGGRTDISYGFAKDAGGNSEQCTGAYVASLPGVWASKKDCFAPRDDGGQSVWMNKYLVTDVTLSDATLGLLSVDSGKSSLGSVRKYIYQYLGDPGWRFDGNTRSTPFPDRSWSDWRGYQTSRVKTMRTNKSDPSNPTPVAKSVRKIVVYRGMNNSRADKTNTFITAHICTVEHGACTSNDDQPLDSNYLQGDIAEETTLNGVDGTWISRTYHGYQAYRTAHSQVGLSAHFAQENLTRTHTHVLHCAVQPDPSKTPSCPAAKLTSYDRRHPVETTYNPGGGNHQGLLLGTVQTTTDRGASTSADPAGDKNVCTTTSWIGNSDVWLRAPTQATVKDNDCADLRAQTSDYYEASETQNASQLNNGHLTKVTTATDATATGNPITSHTRYDTYGRVIHTQTDGSPGHSVDTTYNPPSPGSTATVDDLATTITVTTNPGATDQRTTTTTLNADRGLPTTVTDVDNNASTKMGYDGYGRLTKLTKPNLAAQGGNASSVTYDYQVTAMRPSKVTTTTRRDAAASDTSIDFVDGWGRTIETQTPQVDGDGRLVTATGYDELGLPWLQIPVFANTSAPGQGLLNPNPNQAVRFTRTDYDAAGRTTAIVDQTYDPSNPGTPATHDTTTIDQRGDGTAVHPAVGGQTLTTLDGWGRTTTVEQDTDQTSKKPLHLATYRYDGASNLTGISATIGGTVSTWAYGYDLAGRRISTNDPDTGVTNATYDDDGNQTTTKTTADGTIQTLYDNQDRPTKRFRINTASQTPLTGCTATAATDPTCTLLAQWTYDTATRGDGRLASSTSYNPYNQLGTYTHTITGYDRDGNTLGVTYAYPGDISGATPTGATTMTQSWSYNDADLPISTSYDAVGNLPALTITNAYTVNALLSTQTTSDQTNLLTASYDKTGQPLRALSGAAGDVNHHLYREYAWDNDTGWLTRIGASAFGTLDYRYDKIGNPTSVTAGNLWQNQATADPSTWCYTYDPLNRLATAKTGAATAAYDCATPAADTNLIGAHQNLQYTYNDDRLTKATSIGSATNTATYAYNNTTPHQTSKITSNSGDPNLPPGNTLTYDSAGRITQLKPTSGAATVYTYNPTGSLKDSTTGTGTGSTASAYAYDTDGTRLARRVTGQSSVFYLGDTEITTTSNGTTARRILDTPAGTPLAIQTGTGTTTSPGTPSYTYVLGDAQQSIRYTRDQTTGYGTDTRPTYRPYGQAITTTGAGERGYLNKPTDPNGDLRLDQRNYQANLNIVTTPDPLLTSGNPQSLNPYAYASNNPIANSDPSGLYTLPPDGSHSLSCADSGGDNCESGYPEPPSLQDQQAASGQSVFSSAYSGVNHLYTGVAESLGLGSANTPLSVRGGVASDSSQNISTGLAQVRPLLILLTLFLVPGNEELAPEEAIALGGASSTLDGPLLAMAGDGVVTSGVRDSFIANGSTVRYSHTATAIGDDDATLSNFSKSLGASGRHDVIVHGTRGGEPIVDSRVVNPEQIAEAIRENPSYIRGCDITLVMCHGARGTAQVLARSLGVDVYSTTRQAALDFVDGSLIRGGF